MLLWMLSAWATTTVVSSPITSRADGATALAHIPRTTGDVFVAEQDGQLFVAGPTLERLIHLPDAWDTEFFASDLDGDGDHELVSHRNGIVRVRDPILLTVLHTFRVSPGIDVDVHGVHDLDLDGQPELVYGYRDEVCAIGGIQWCVTPSTPFGDVVVAQLDGDAELEVFAGDVMLDGVTGSQQRRLMGFSSADDVVAGDVNQDGLTDLLIHAHGNWWLWDQASNGVLWSVGLGRGALLVDVDGDGDDDMVAIDSALVARDGRTGAVVQTGPFVLCCDPLLAIEPFPGERFLRVGSDTFTLQFTPFSTSFTHTLGAPQRANLDGVGPDEIVFAGGAMPLVLDLHGNLLPSRMDAQSVGTWVLVDVYGDGRLEAVTTGGAIRAHGWSRQGWSAPHTLLSTSRALDGLHVGDWDGDGYVDVMHSTATEHRRLDLSTGQDSLLSLRQGGARYVDLDGDGDLDMTEQARFTLTVRDHQTVFGQLVAVGAYEIVDTHLGPGLLVTEVSGDAVLFALRQGALREVARVTPPRPAHFYAEGGRLWYQDVGAVEAFDPLTGDVWRFETPFPLSEAPLMANGAVWLSSGAVLERFPLP